MKDIEWGPVLSIGVDEIDDDHQKLINIFNILNQSLTSGEPAEYIAAVLEELINCTVWHFSHEERLMLKHDYPELDEHRAIHQDLINTIHELRHKVLQGGKVIGVAQLDVIEKWLTGHILTDDMKLGAYLSQVM